MRLVADVGGTNTRVALAEDARALRDVKSYANIEWTDLYAVLTDYLASSNASDPDEMVLAMAGPVEGTSARLTNRDWSVTTADLMSKFGLNKVGLLNDLTALGYAVPSLQDTQVLKLKSGNAQAGPLRQSLVVGLGTGFNVSPVVAQGDRITCPSVEAGHVSLPRRVHARLERAAIDPDLFPSVEDLFSGRGFELFCQTASERATITGKEAIALYGAASAQDISRAIDLFSELLGRLLVDVSMSYMPRAGLFLAGSVARAVMSVAPTPCLAELDGPFKIAKASQIPIWKITDDGAALMGCASYTVTEPT